VLVISVPGRKVPARLFGLRPSEKELPVHSVTKVPLIRNVISLCL
jgi:hypothetical protein